MSANVCPSCSRPLPAAVVSGPAQAVVRCEGCQTLLLWSNGRVMRSAKSTTGTMMGMPAVQVPAQPGAPKPPASAKARESEAPLPELRPEADAAPQPPKTPPPRPAPPKTPPPRPATQPVARVPSPKQTITGIGDNVPTKVVAPSPELRKESARKDPTPPPMKVPPSAPIKVAPTAPATVRRDPTPPPMKVPPSGPLKVAPSGPLKVAPSGPNKIAPASEAPHVVAAVAQVPQMSDGDMVDPSAWFAGDVSEVVPPEKAPPLPAPPLPPPAKSAPIIESTRPARADTTGAAPLPPPPSLPTLEAEPFEIEAPGSEKTPAIGTLMPEARPQDSAPIAVGREPSQRTPTPAREPSQKIATDGKKSAASIRGADPQTPPPSAAPPRGDMPSPATSIGKPPTAPLRSTVMGRPAAETPRAAEAPTPARPTPTATPTPKPVRAAEPVAAAVSLLPPSAPSVSSSTKERADSTPVKAHAAVNAPTATVEREVSAEALPPPPSAARADTTAETMQPETTRLPLAIPRRLLFIVGGAAAGVIVLVLLVVAAMSHGPKKPSAVTPPKLTVPAPIAKAPTPTPTTPPTAPVVESPKPTAPAPIAVAPETPPATPEPTEAPVAPPPPRPRRTLGGKKVVLEYDPKPTSPVPPPPQVATPMGEDPATVARAREAYHKGNVKLFAGDSAGAIALYRESLKIYPGYVAGYRGLGLGYEAAGNNDEALKAFHTYVRTVPSANDTPIIRRRIDRLESQKSGGAQ